MRGYYASVVLLFVAATASTAQARGGDTRLANALHHATVAYASWDIRAQSRAGSFAAQTAGATALKRTLGREKAIVGRVRPVTALERTAKTAVNAAIDAAVAVAKDSLRLQAAARAYRSNGDQPSILRKGGDAAAALRADSERFLVLRDRALRLMREIDRR